MRFLRPLLAGACLLFAATSCPAADHAVRVGGTDPSHPDIGFIPYEITISVGDTITFHMPQQGAGILHNVHALDQSFRCAVGCDGAGGNGDPAAGEWSSTVTFNHAGTINYQCDPHASMGMRGIIHVVDGTPPPANVPITPGFTGAWYDPQQSGHGLFLEVLTDNRILAWWFTFNPDGTQQAWFGNVGAINGDTASVAAVQTEGGRWIPNFDHANVTQPPWGTLTFTFTDCNHGRVDFSSVVPGYGEGHMDLTRLTQPAGLACP